jgi:type II secretory pathway component GspD/PulD (secretin)
MPRQNLPLSRSRNPFPAMKELLALLLLVAACVRAQDETLTPPRTPPPGAPPAAPLTPPPTPPPTGLPPAAPTTLRTNDPANAERIELLRRQFQERIAARTNAAAAAAAAAARPGGSPPAGAPATTGPAAGVNVPPAVSVPDPTPIAVAPPLVPGSAVRLVFPENDPATNSMKFAAVDLNTFLDFYADFIGRTILRPASLPAQTITLQTKLPLTRREMVEAMDTVLSMNGVSTILVGEKFVKVVQTSQVLPEAAPVSALSALELPEAAQYVVHIAQLKHIKPTEIAPVLQPFSKIPSGVVPIDPSGVLVLRDFAENVKRMLQIIELVDVEIPQEFISEVIAIKYAKASDIAQALGSLGGGGGATTIGGAGGGVGGSLGGGMMGGGMGNRSGMGSRGSSSMGRGMSGYGGGYGGVTPYGSQTALGSVGAVGSTPGAAAGGSFSDRLRGIIQRASSPDDVKIIGPNKIIADENSNQLLIFASRADMKTIKEIIDKLDTISPQVLIESLILEVSLNDGMQTAFDYAYVDRGDNAISQITKAVPTVPPADIAQFGSNATGGLSWLGRINDRFFFRINAAAQAGKVSVLSRPRIQTSHAQPASFFVGETRPYPTGTSYGGYGGNYSQIQQLNIGVTLNVVPLINQDGLVVLEIAQSTTSFGGNVTIENVGEVPITLNRDASSKVSVRTGETIVLGGFISSNNNKNDSGVPFLKDLPLVGPLFRASSKSSVRQELIILIRPTVLPNPADAALAAADLKSKMPLTRTAEIELQEDWAKYQRMADDLEAATAKRKAREAGKQGGASKYDYQPVPDLDMMRQADTVPPAQPFQYGPESPNFYPPDPMPTNQYPQLNVPNGAPK